MTGLVINPKIAGAIVSRRNTGITPIRFVPTLEKPLADGMFLGALGAMESHYATLTKTRYPLATDVYRVPGLRDKDLREKFALNRDKMVEDIAEKSKQGAVSWVQKIQTGIDAAFNTLKTTSDTDAFLREIEGLEAKAKERADKEIRSIFEAIRKCGMQDPSCQPRLLKAAQDTGSFWSNTFDDFKGFVGAIIGKIKQFFDDAIAWLEQAAKDVVNWVTGVVDDVGDFFDNLF